jgi:hypothetical protein
MLVYNIKRLDQYTGVSDLIAKLKNGTLQSKKSCFASNELFRLSKDSTK